MRIFGSPIPPSTRLCAQGATLILNLSASDEVVGKADYRRQLVTGQSARLACGYVYADAGEGESSTDLVFGGHNLIAENGSLLAERRFATGLTVSEIDVDRLAYERRRMTTFPAGESMPTPTISSWSWARPSSPGMFPPIPSCLRTRGTGRSGATRF